VLTDLTPLSNLADVDLLLGINPNVPAKNVAELISYAKANPAN
jgi:tripartite-type tricarboxylate transporter receptor subunit TctC